jgi:hypothetical protein
MELLRNPRRRPAHPVEAEGVETADATDGKASSGIIAIRLHAGEPMKVELRNVKLKPLP